jgi:hypothetical protein
MSVGKKHNLYIPILLHMWLVSFVDKEICYFNLLLMNGAYVPDYTA